MTRFQKQKPFHKLLEMNGSRNSTLDMIRGLAALEVALGHLRYFLFVDFPQVAHPGIWVKAFYYLTAFGHQSVVVFFVLSGYLVGGSVLASKREGFARRYSVQRLSRLWIVLLPCLVGTAVFNTLGYHFGGADFLNGKLNPPMFIGPAGHPVSTDFVTFLGNVFFLQKMVTPVYGDNGPLWSLANEFWYYVIFPLMYFGIKQDARATFRTRFACTGAGLMILLALPWNVGLGFFVWLAGMAVAALERAGFKKAFGNKWYGLLALVACGISFHFSRYVGMPDIVLGLTFSAALLFLVRLSPLPRLIASPSVWLSDFSYTLYLAHFSFVAFIWYAVLDSQRLQPSWTAMIRFGVLAGLLVANSFGLSLLFERNTEKLRRFIMRLLAGNQPNLEFNRPIPGVVATSESRKPR
jgi:peptidoglycan/LPS O-acetylase OafA/YrhL